MFWIFKQAVKCSNMSQCWELTLSSCLQCVKAYGQADHHKWKGFVYPMVMVGSPLVLLSVIKLVNVTNLSTLSALYISQGQLLADYSVEGTHTLMLLQWSNNYCSHNSVIACPELSAWMEHHPAYQNKMSTFSDNKTGQKRESTLLVCKAFVVFMLPSRILNK